jgi:hypothetical protein
MDFPGPHYKTSTEIGQLSQDKEQETNRIRLSPTVHERLLPGIPRAFVVTFRRFEMDESDKPPRPSLSISVPSDLPPGDLLVLQHLLSETEPMNALWSSVVIDPVALHFLPESGWSQQMFSLQTLRDDYFGRKNNVNRRFEHKLWNALRITSAFPNMLKLIGVVWVTDSVIKVYKYPFAKLLNIPAIDGGLFHKQGNFTRHGFVVLSDGDAHLKVPPEHLFDVDFRDVLLITHQHGLFTVMSTEGTIGACKWDNPVGVTRVATLRPRQ